jgi:DNA-binding NarL/FixJ family response regulator
MSTGPNLIRILAVDDDSIFRQGIVSFSADQADMELVAEACNGREAIQQFRSHHPTSPWWTCRCPE